ncbi:hypothetical protein H2201_004349 [Coniosporium apollinis]|uniref:Septin-type G domain-containing protein n=1 Tax=Coniosporium apollinis TaxID=61459 RepID=A0ABQ9NZB9_9PEZI|nr:hypothetical protein H2201_004349 [Coniosporium apollinis]
MGVSSKGDAAQSRSRKSSVADNSTTTPSHASAAPTSFFLRSESEMEQMAEASTLGPRDSTYGVQSLEDALAESFSRADTVHEDDDIEKKSRRGSNAGSHTGSVTSSAKRRSVADTAWMGKGIAGIHPPSSDYGSPSSRLRNMSRSPVAAYGKDGKGHIRRNSFATLPETLTPLNMESPMPASEAGASTPKSASLMSFRLSDEESVASQAIASSEEDEEDAEAGADKDTEGDASLPQLVMPSIQMPTRRPFTDRGKRMGRLKVMVVGPRGVGKTSLIRSIMQVCEDVVHVDPLSSTTPVIQIPQPKQSKGKKAKENVEGTTTITEIHASTKPYPHWWSDMDESRVLRRRKSSSGDTVLERNLCFIDTPGQQSADGNDVASEHVESLLHRNMSITSMSDGDLLSILSGGGGVQVDVVLYVVSHPSQLETPLEHLRRLSSLTNVIPVLSNSDVLSLPEAGNFKLQILESLREADIRPFLFGKTIEDAVATVQAQQAAAAASPDTSNTTVLAIPCPPYAVSSAPDNEADMDASLLMSPSYVQPLLPSELAALVSQVLDPDSIAWLRHSAVKKFLRWRSALPRPTANSMLMHNLPHHFSTQGPGLTFTTSPAAAASTSPLSTAASSSFSSRLLSASPSGVLVPHRPHSPASAFDMATASYALAKYRDYTQREERLAQVRLAKWATDLQRSLENERRRYAELQQTERKRWLLERVGDEVGEGKVGTGAGKGMPAVDVEWALVKHGEKGKWKEGGAWERGGALRNPRDPLGLCEWGDDFRKRCWLLVQVLGSCGVIGAVAVAVVRFCESGGEGFGFEGWWKGWVGE